MNIKPEGEVFYDDHDMHGSELFDQFKAEKGRNLELYNEAAQEFEKSSNPEGKAIASLLRALYLREKAKKESDDEKACHYLLRSSTLLGKNKQSKSESLRLMLEFYNRKLKILHKKKKSPSEVFRKRANIFKELGLEKEYHVEMSLYCLNLAIGSPRDLKKSITLLDESLAHAKQSGYEEIVNKISGIHHKIKSYAAPTLEDAIKEIQEELKAIENTSDKYGKEVALGDLNFLLSKREQELEKKLSLIEDAASYYEKASMPERAHQLRGDSFQLKGNKTNPFDNKHAEYYKLASEEYGKAGNGRMQKWLEGHYEIALATKLGVLVDNNEEFRKHLMLANHAYTHAGNVGGVQFTAGVGLFLEAVRANHPQSLELFKAAAECLESVKETFLAAFANSERLRIMASKSEKEDEREKLMLEEKNYLERAIIESGKKTKKPEISFPIDGVIISTDTLTTLSKARAQELNGFLEKNRETAKVYFGRAKQEYLSLESSGAYKTLVLSGLGWTSLFLNDVLEATKYFDKLKEIAPKNPHVKAGIDALDELIKVKYSPEAENYAIKKRLSTPLMVSLGNDTYIVKSGKSYPSDFFDTWRAVVNKSCNQIERFKIDFFASDEPSIRNEILRLSNSIAEVGLGATLTGETLTGKGKSDLFAKNNQEENDYFIGESKIWKSKGEYKKGFKQLVNRYLTATDKAGLLLNFVKTGTMNSVSTQAIAAIKELDPETKINTIDTKNFVSIHKEYGMIFHHLVDLIQERAGSEK